MDTVANQNQQSINAALKEAIGNINLTDSAGGIADKNDKLTLIDYKMVTFSLAGKDYAIDIMKVKEIAKAGRFTYVPNTLPFVLGVYNLRGEIIPIVDLRLFFNISMPERKFDALENMLIVSVGDQTFGVVVDAIDKVVGIQKSTIQPPHPLFGDINIKFIQGVVEVNNRLYILLDIERIFGSKIDPKAMEKKAVAGMKSRSTLAVDESAGNVASSPAESGSVVPPPVPAPVESKVDLSFIQEGLSSMRKFVVTPINENWVQSRYKEWEGVRGKDNTQLQNQGDADEFLKSFYSPCSGDWWSKEYADAIYKALPDNSAKQIVVWNPGSGKGYESYSLACLLKKRYPEARVRIYAHDIDLLSISNAPMLSIPGNVANDWYAPYVTKKANGDYTFTQEVKDCIMFEYHDCTHTNALPVLDLIFARDLLSFLPKDTQMTLVGEFFEKLKGNGMVLLGKNESLGSDNKWTTHNTDTITTFGKQ